MIDKSRLKKNTFSSLIFQVTTIVCGFVLPRLILGHFGSEINGLVNSVTQFLHVIALLELGVGAVVQSALYKPLADKDSLAISGIIVSANNFFRRLAQILAGYIIVLICAYPYIAKQNFGFVYTGTLILAISISSFAQYYFGVVDRLLLASDQRGYIQYYAQTATLILNTLACYVLIELGASIHIVKLSTSLIFLVRPFFLRWYVNRHYNINRKLKLISEPIKQKWNGLAQHVAAIALDGTGNIVLSVLTNMVTVSVYSVYMLVFAGVRNLALSLTVGTQAIMGELWAKQNLHELHSFFSWVEWVVHTATVIIFGCTFTLVVPFVQVFTLGVHDAEYTQAFFAGIMTLAYGVRCLRLPHNTMILAANHYKQTQSNYLVAVVINVFFAVVLTWKFGLVGVAFGVLFAMIYQTIWMARYDSKNLLCLPMSHFWKQIFVDIISCVVCIVLTMKIGVVEVSYIAWLVLAIKVFIVWIFGAMCVNYLFYKDKVKRLLDIMMRMWRKIL